MSDRLTPVRCPTCGRVLGQREEPLSTRETPHDPDLVTRSLSVRAATANDEERSVEGLISTEAPVQVYDWRRGEVIDEILLNSGANLPDQLPLLDNHDRWSTAAVLGSVRGFRNDTAADGTPGKAGRLFFVKGDQDAERVWNKVRQAHLRDLSVGYRVDEATEVAPGQSAVIGGRTFTAGKITLRVATRWTGKEVSVTPIGADSRTKTRTDSSTQGVPMNPQLRAYLESIGLRHEATEAEAQTFAAGLKDEQRTRADALKDGQRNDPPANPPSQPPHGQRQDPPANPTSPPADPAEVARQAVAAERDRVRQITELAGADVPAEIRQRAVDEGWEVSRANGEFLTAVRAGRQSGESVSGGAPAGHVRSHARDVNARSLAAAMLIQQGLDPTRCREYDTARQDLGIRFTQQDADLGERIRGLSAPDLFRECVRADTGRSYQTIDEALARVRDDREQGRAAVSGGTLGYVFGTSIYAKLVEGWGLTADSTTGWVDEEDVPNFLSQEEITLDMQGRPEQHAPGGTAKDATLSDSHETYRAYRFSRKASVDEMDIINDRLGAVMKFPVLLGQAFRRMRPNLVYSTLLSNPTLVADSKAVFHADHGNLGTGALASGSLATALSAMAAQRDAQNEVLDIQARYLIVPSDLSFSAASLLNGVALAKTHATKSDPDYIPVNPVGPMVIKQVIGDNLTLVNDARLGATGCWNPMTKKMQTGSATNWFLSAGPFRGIRVLYRRGTNRQPAVRSYTLDKGQWGVGWDMNLDIGCKILDFRGLYKSSGTA